MAQYQKTLAISLEIIHPYYVELDNFIRAEQKFNSLPPSHRVEMALINAFGSIIKSISGNLNAEDVAISELESNQKVVVITLNKQTFTSEILENFNETVTHIMGD